MATAWIRRGCTSWVLQGDGGWSQGCIKGMRLRMSSHNLASWVNWTKTRTTGHWNYKVSGKKGLRKSGRRSFLCFWVMIPGCPPPPRWKSWTTTFLNFRFFVKANMYMCTSGYTCHTMPMPKPLYQQYILTLQETTFIFSFWVWAIQVICSYPLFQKLENNF